MQILDNNRGHKDPRDSARVSKEILRARLFCAHANADNLVILNPGHRRSSIGRAERKAIWHVANRG